MSWLIYVLGAISALAISDLLRKLGSNLNDPFLNNLIFQIGSVSMAIVLWIFFSRKFESNTRGIMYAITGGILVSVFTVFFFKSLAVGPGVSTVVPIVRIGALLLVVLAGLLLFSEKFTWSLGCGLVLAVGGVYLVLLGK